MQSQSNETEHCSWRVVPSLTPQVWKTNFDEELKAVSHYLAAGADTAVPAPPPAPAPQPAAPRSAITSTSPLLSPLEPTTSQAVSRPMGISTRPAALSGAAPHHHSQPRSSSAPVSGHGQERPHDEGSGYSRCGVVERAGIVVHGDRTLRPHSEQPAVHSVGPAIYSTSTYLHVAM